MTTDTDLDKVAHALPAYDIGNELGRGAMGVVISGQHRQLGRPVAIKQLPLGFGQDPTVKVRFVQKRGCWLHSTTRTSSRSSTSWTRTGCACS